VIIDSHAHVWPDHIARQIVAGTPAGLPPLYDGTADGLLRTMDAAGIDMACALGVAVRGATVQRTNDFIGSLDRSRFVPFGTVHPDLGIEENLGSLADNGIRAVKFHPNFQEASLSDPRVVDLMCALAERETVVLTHAGRGDDDAATERGAPAKIAALVAAVPDLTLIACHFGGYHRLSEAERHVIGQRLILETSWPPAVNELEPQRVRSIVLAHGTGRVVFGSDWPMARPATEIETVRSWVLSPEVEAAILGGTLAALLGIG
jgi:uncharacterized protein